MNKLIQLRLSIRARIASAQLREKAARQAIENLRGKQDLERFYKEVHQAAAIQQELAECLIELY